MVYTYLYERDLISFYPRHKSLIFQRKGIKTKHAHCSLGFIDEAPIVLGFGEFGTKNRTKTTNFFIILCTVAVYENARMFHKQILKQFLFGFMFSP